jgi:hypothetical protein
LRAHPIDRDAAYYKALVIVFTDLSADRAKDYIDDVQILQIMRPFYEDDGVVLGAFHERNEGSAIYNPNFQPFKSPGSVSTPEAWGHQRLEVLSPRRRVAWYLGASL